MAHRRGTALSLIGACVVALAAAPLAEAKKEKAHRSKAEVLNKVLELSDEQQQQVERIVQKFQPQHEALKAEENSQIRGALTPDQQAKFDEWLQRKADRKQKRKDD